MPRLFISATRKSSGKTTVALGLCAAFKQRGLQVRPFKKGPDYIDPMWLSRAADSPCINLDFNTMHEPEIRTAYHRHAHTGDLAVIEGNKGLYDGLDPEGGDSNAALAKLLDAPVVLVLDASGMTRGVAPLVLGYQAFDREVRIAGVILNNVGGTRHESKLRAALERYTDLAVVGALHFNRELQIAQRHLGLATCADTAEAAAIVRNIAAAVTAQVDVDAIKIIAEQAAPLALPNLPPPDLSPPATQPEPIKIGIARDAAFGFYYADDLRAFAAHGAQLIPFDTINDRALPDVHALFIGGGFPEVHAEALSNNHSMRAEVKHFVERGKPVYAECGGLMYLTQSLSWSGATYPMAGAIAGRVEMNERPAGRGYVVLEETGAGLWQENEPGNGATIHAHEFHYSKITGLPPDSRFAYRVKRGDGIDGKFDGLVYRNTLANYSHFRNTEDNPWVARFVEFVRAHKAAKHAPNAHAPEIAA